MRAYYLRSRRGHQIAVVAVARKLAVLFWCLLTRHQQYAHQQPSLTAKKMRLLEIRGGAPSEGPADRHLCYPREDARSRAGARTGSRGVLRAHGPRLAGHRPNKKAGASVTPGRA
jgi:transposase